MAFFTGTNGADTLVGSGSGDSFRGLSGDDLIRGEGGADQFDWTYGDGSDTVDGGEGLDTQLVRSFSTTASESFIVEKSGDQIRVHAGATLHLDNVEVLTIQPFLGADTVEIRDFIGTDLSTLKVDLAGYSGLGDGEADRVILTGTDLRDQVYVQPGYSANSVRITTSALNGHQRTVDIAALDAKDTITLNLGGGADAFNGANVLANMIVNGGAGADFLVGGAGDNTLRGGLDDDQIYGGDGKDVIIWANGPNIGDGRDTVDGGAGVDTQILIGASNVSNNFRLEAVGDKLEALVGPQLTIDDVERVQIEAVGTYDSVEIHDLSATDVRTVDVNLASPGDHQPDGEPDSVTLYGSSDVDKVSVTLGADNASLRIEDSIGGVVQTINVSALDDADHVSFTLGAGNDSFRISGPGGPARMMVYGDAGDDTFEIGADVKVTFMFAWWDEGSDVVIGFKGHADGGDDVIIPFLFDDFSYEDMVANGHLVQQGADVLITDGVHTLVTLQDVALSSLSAADFMFS